MGSYALVHSNLRIMQKEFIAQNTSELNDIAKAIMPVIHQNPIVAFYGEMGAGKTTFVHALCEEMGIAGSVNSPTFAIINEYEAKDGQLVYHFDFYRINSVDEAYDFGYEEYFSSGNLCFIEWPQLIEPLLPANTTKIKIEVLEDESRKISVE